MEPVLFYDKDRPFYEFTNFYDRAPFIDTTRRQWKTSEHYFQAHKFESPALQEEVRNLPFARDAFDFTRRRPADVRKDWRDKNLAIMWDALYFKFTQNPHALRCLLETGNRRLVEHTVKDNFWGDGGDGSGQNKLGQMLMDLRTHLRQHPPAAPAPAPALAFASGPGAYAPAPMAYARVPGAVAQPGGYGGIPMLDLPDPLRGPLRNICFDEP
ncbi:putative GTP cyclohydrolase II [Paratrimastix pyriformis]|uniref:GTP cyclohydrolase II n=1 Tax=Paratrimastix pyriformis TaxID=342808 RepID=A0ABQ8USU8_9EUKA|nr:putative GTP cyclohydrolase II [Paratrimastix pyriformis]